MEILYIWNGKNELSQQRKDCMERVHNLYPECTFTCLTNSSPLPFLFPVPWDKSLREVATFFSISEIPKQWDNFMAFSDWYRFYYLINHPDTLYLDTDCKLNVRYDFESKGNLIYPENEIFLLYAPSNGIFAKMKLLLERYALLKCYGTLLGIRAYLQGKDFTEILDESVYSHI
jgi:hypothetical protein